MGTPLHDGADQEETGRGRLFVVTGGDDSSSSAVGAALARSLDRAVAIDGAVFDHMVVAGRAPYAEPPEHEQLRQLFLRWSASIATAETYQLEGFDAVVSDSVLGGYLEDFLDLASPETIHLVVLVPDQLAPAIPRWGLWVGTGGQTAEQTAATVLGRLAESVVAT